MEGLRLLRRRDNLKDLNTIDASSYFALAFSLSDLYKKWTTPRAAARSARSLSHSRILLNDQPISEIWVNSEAFLALGSPAFAMI